MKALIGHTGFVGSNILSQTTFDHCYNSQNIKDIRGKEYDLVVCAGVSSIKWKANKFPEEDFLQIENLINNLNQTNFKKIILISTIAVYDNPADNAYGRNRLFLENYLTNKYPTTIIRLPALFGKGLKKNAIYDLLHQEHEYLPNSKSQFQYYSLDNLWSDICVAIEKHIKVLNIATEPVPFYDIMKLFNRTEVQNSNKPIITENMKSSHCHYWGKKGDYLYNSSEIMAELKQFIKKYDNPKRDR